MRSPVTAAAAREAVFSALDPVLDLALDRLAVLHVPGVGASVLVQSDPTVVRVLVEGPASACEALRLTGPEIPGEAAVAAAMETFVSAGLSALPPAVADGVFAHASKEGAGLMLWARPLQNEVDCLLAVSRVSLDRAKVLFSVTGSCATPRASSATETTH